MLSSWQVDLEQAIARHPSGLVVQFQPLTVDAKPGYVGIPLNLEQVAVTLAESVEDESELRETFVEMLNEACEAFHYQLSRRH
jgi:uncharacterized protein YpbB